MIAAVGDTPYRIVLLLHVLTAMAAFAPVFVHPMLQNQSKSLGTDAHRGVMALLTKSGRTVNAPALILTGLFGFGLQGMSSGTWKFNQAWMIAAVIVWVAMNGVVHALVMPNEQRMADGDESAQRMADLGGAILTALLVIMLWLMIFKPGV